MVYFINLVEYPILDIFHDIYIWSKILNLVSNVVWQNNISSFLSLIPYIVVYLPTDHLEVLWVLDLSEY